MLKRLLLGLFLLGMAAIGAGIYWAAFTSAPIRIFTARLQSAGIFIEGVDGDLMRGFSFASVKFTNAQFDWAAENVRVSYTVLGQLLTEKSFFVDELVVDRFRLTQRSSDQRRTAAARAPETENFTRQKFPFEAFGVRRIRLRNLEVRLAKFATPLVGSEIEIREAALRGDRISVESAKLLSRGSEANLRGFSYALASGQITLREKLTGSLGPALWAALKKPIPFEVSLFQPGMKGAYEIKLGGNQLRFARDADQRMTLVTEGLELQETFRTDFPVTQMNIKVSAFTEDELLRGVANVALTAQLSPAEFQTRAGEGGDRLRMPGAIASLIADQGEVRYVLDIRPTALSYFASLKTALQGEGELPKISSMLAIGSSSHTEVPEVLAQLRYGKPYASLTPDEKLAVDPATEYFSSLTTPIEAGAPIPPLPKPAVIAVQPPRDPSLPRAKVTKTTAAKPPKVVQLETYPALDSAAPALAPAPARRRSRLRRAPASRR